MSIQEHNPVVTLDFTDLVNSNNLFKEIEAAFGFDGLGVLLIKNAPGAKEFRESFLPMAKK